MVLVGMYLLVSDTVVVVMVGVAWGWSFFDSLTFEPPPPPPVVSCCGGTGEGVFVSRVLSGVLSASSISSCALVMERWVPYRQTDRQTNNHVNLFENWVWLVQLCTQA
jgi:hypothetical protein